MHDLRLDPGRPARAHDLLWLDDPGALLPVGRWPAWARRDWLAVAPVVVRRAPTRPDGRLPVGVRGATRAERCAAHAVGARVVRRLAPEEVARSALGGQDLPACATPCLRTLSRLAPALDALGLPWGVTGSVGFSLASGLDVLRVESDLDLLVRVADRRGAAALRALASLTRALDCRVDVQVDTDRGGFALDEWTRTGGPVLLKTAHGPVLCRDPWDAVASTGLPPGGG